MSKSFESAVILGSPHPFLGPRLTEFLDNELRSDISLSLNKLTLDNIGDADAVDDALRIFLSACNPIIRDEIVYSHEDVSIETDRPRGRSLFEKQHVNGIRFKALAPLRGLYKSEVIHYTPDGLHHPESRSLYIMRKGAFFDAIEIRHDVKESEIETADSLVGLSVDFLDIMINEYNNTVAKYVDRFKAVSDQWIERRRDHLMKQDHLSNKIEGVLDKMRNRR